MDPCRSLGGGGEEHNSDTGETWGLGRRKKVQRDGFVTQKRNRTLILKWDELATNPSHQTTGGLPTEALDELQVFPSLMSQERRGHRTAGALLQHLHGRHRCNPQHSGQDQEGTVGKGQCHTSNRTPKEALSVSFKIKTSIPILLEQFNNHSG